MAQFDQIDLDTVAALLDKTPKMIRNYMNLKGMPNHGDGRNRYFIWRDVLAWWVDYQWSLETGTGNQGNEEAEMETAEPGSEPQKPEDIRSATLRKTKAEADLKQLALSRLRGEVITIMDAKVRVDRTFGNLRTQLLGMGPKLATRLAGVKDLNTIEATIKEEMEVLCRDLSSGTIVGIQADDEAMLELSAAADEDPTEEQLDELVKDLVEIYASIEF
jgi:hypothetical protein